MAESDALHAALVLVKDPVSVRKLQRAELPGGIPAVLAIAIGEEAALAEAQVYTGRSRAALTEAAGFFVEQVLLDHDADSYRVLGGSRRSTHEELRHNMALLMRWLHPDLQALRNHAAADREVFSSRVTRAWEDLKNDERRRAYDRLHPPAPPSNGGTSKSARAPANTGTAKAGIAKTGSANGASTGRRPGSASKPPFLRARPRFAIGSRRGGGGSFWMRLIDLFRRSP
jgi:hypothetical protein